jgi:uncharacterized protein YgiM (DUF1202 family)
MVHATIAIATLALFLAAVPAHAKPQSQQCEKKGNKPQIFIKPNTPLYRGPGLNYPVAGFLERGRCAPFTEVSMDRLWVLVDLGDKGLGWVERSTLATQSQELIAKAAGGDGAPIGSGQKRAYVEAKQQVMLMERPAQSGEPKSTLPEGSRLLPLAITKTGKWIQVRDDRSEIGWVMASHVKGENLDSLPVAEDTLSNRVAGKGETDEDPDPPVALEEDLPPPTLAGDGAVHFFAAAFGAALNPIHSLTTNSPNGYRTYDVSAFSGGAAVELGVTDLGPIALRLGYQFVAVTGVSPETNPAVAASGYQHDAQLRVGYPLAAGPLLVTPELGYYFGMFDFDQNLPTTGARFISSMSHLGSAGARFQIFATRSVMLELDGAFLFGGTFESLVRLGNSGFTLGFLGAAGAQFLITDMISVVARYHASYRSTPYTGAAFDTTISKATLTDVTHGLLLGVAFSI